MTTSGRDTLCKLPRVIRSLLMRDLLRLLCLEKLKGWEKAVSGLRNGLTQLPSGRFLVHWFEGKSGETTRAYRSSWSEERDTVEALTQIAEKKGWVKTNNAEVGMSQFDITDSGKKILEEWDRNRSRLLAGLIVGRKFNGRFTRP